MRGLLCGGIGFALGAVEQVAAGRARDLWIDYLHAPDADLLELALGHLASVDVDAARREATALLDGPRAASLTGEQLAALKRFAGKP
ncbi:MAG: hypothetical protein L6Q95_11995 [Planctomycetes bacterium]|nr:hypothetical protein [Planctomycetota bacterium]